MAVDLSSIGTLTAAYLKGELKPARVEPFYAHNGAINERVSLYRGDMTKLAVGAIVNAANRSLLGGGGVDGAIHRAAGSDLLRECRTLNGCATGRAKITKGYNLPAAHVIHAVGPIYDDDEADACEEKLQSCYHTSLQLCVENKIESVAFSGISTGIYGYPLDDATHVALRTTHNFLNSDAGQSIQRVIFTLFRQIDVDSYKKILPLYFPPAEEATRATSLPAPVETDKLAATAMTVPDNSAPNQTVVLDEAQPMSRVEETELATPRPADDDDELHPMSQVEDTGPASSHT
ncbi:A1pp-domain-containing protein [Auriculariales sp. MPI-PUGE-AT-0066]|nr:A1pp-domain-containing protein [Auriculariales sp. MPI-PUGE-AT-0066]